MEMEETRRTKWMPWMETRDVEVEAAECECECELSCAAVSGMNAASADVEPAGVEWLHPMVRAASRLTQTLPAARAHRCCTHQHPPQSSPT
jgi:hypothetical protein